MSLVTVKMMKMTTTDPKELIYFHIDLRLINWVDSYINQGGNTQLSKLISVKEGLLLEVEHFQNKDFESFDGEYFMDGLRTSHPDLYRFSVGYFGGHDFVWRLK